MESKQRRNFAVLSRAHRRPSRRDTRQRLKREKKKKGKNENLAKRSRNFKLYIFTLPWQFIRFRWSSRGFALMGNEFNGRGMQFAIPRPYYSKTLSLFYSTVDNPRLSLMFRSFPLIFFFSFPLLSPSLFHFASPWLLPGSFQRSTYDSLTTYCGNFSRPTHRCSRAEDHTARFSVCTSQGCTRTPFRCTVSTLSIAIVLSFFILATILSHDQSPCARANRSEQKRDEPRQQFIRHTPIY